MSRITVALFALLIMTTILSLNSPSHAQVGPTIAECGTLVEDPGGFCVVFQPNSGGGIIYALGGLGTGPFVLGDTVYIEGTVNPNCPTICWSIAGCLDVTLINNCAGVSPIEVCGILVDGAGCMLLSTDTGELYEVANVGSFQLGDQVMISGDLDTSCVSGCGASDGCITNNTIGLCNDAMFRRGDVNNDGSTNIADAVTLLNALFVLGSPAIPCDDASDTNDDGTVNIADATRLLTSLFVLGSPPLPAPNDTCGPDPTDDSIGCDQTGC